MNFHLPYLQKFENELQRIRMGIYNREIKKTKKEL
jgi:hypothetical protein